MVLLIHRQSLIQPKRPMQHVQGNVVQHLRWIYPADLKATCKRTQQLLGVVGQQCCVRLHGALNSVLLIFYSFFFCL